jgi:uncharacterized protein (DUF58 family)
MTKFGIAAAGLGATLATLGELAGWRPVAILGWGIVVLVVGALAYALSHPSLELDRSVARPRVEKGQPAEAVVEATNRSRRRVGPRTIRQWIGDVPVESGLPGLARGETSRRVYRLPTAMRGRFELRAVELPREDPFGICRTARRIGTPELITVLPRVVALRRLPTGVSVNVEGPTSDAAPQGSVTFHRLREYIVGDDLRTVHWPSSAHAGRLVVRHNVDTSQPYTVVVLDLNADVYGDGCFEEAVDVAASVATSMSEARAPVQLRTTAGDRVGGHGGTDPFAIVERLTDVGPIASAGAAWSLAAELSQLRRDRGGSAVVVVTGRIDHSTLPAVSSLRRRFDRVVLVGVDGRPARIPQQPGLTVLLGSNADQVASRWNGGGAR